jgi:tetratricopeptide (TPR) repeat protein
MTTHISNPQILRPLVLAALSLLAFPASAYVLGVDQALATPFIQAASQEQFAEANAALRDGRIDVAEKLFLEANRVKPLAYEPLLGLAMVAQARGRQQLAREWMARAISAAPGEPRLLQARAHLLFDQGLADQAVDSYHEALAANPQSVQLRYDLGSFLLDRLKRPAEASHVLNEVMLLKPDMTSAYLKLAQAQRALGKSEAARRLLDEAARRDPEEVQVPIMQAALSLERGKPELALAFAERALTMRPESSEALVEKANALAALNRVEEALNVYGRVARLAPQSAAPYVMQGRLLERHKRYVEAEAAYREALQTQPGQAVAMNNLAALLALGGSKLDEAAQLAERAVRSDPQRAGFVDTLGLVQLAQGKVDKARQSFELARKLDPENPLYRQRVAQLPPGAATLPAVAKSVVLPATATAKKVAQAEDPASLLGPALEAWRTAWERKDADAYLAHYARHFVPADKRSRAAWVNERRARLSKPGEIEVGISNAVFSRSANVVSVAFEQRYKSANYGDVVRKQIDWVGEDGVWRISREFQR